MREFSTGWPTGHCPKCGSYEEPELEYKAAISANAVLFEPPCCDYEEHMHVKCRVCGYMLPMQTADAKS